MWQEQRMADAVALDVRAPRAPRPHTPSRPCFPACTARHTCTRAPRGSHIVRGVRVYGPDGRRRRYIANACASVLDVALAMEQDAAGIHRVIASVLNFALSHGVLLLASVLHHVPTASPHKWLLVYMRLILLVYTANAWFGVYQDITLGWKHPDVAR